MSKANKPKIEPFLAVFTADGFVPGFADKPNSRQYIAATVSTFHLEKYGKFEYFGGTKKRGKIPALPSGELYWIDGMGKWATGQVWLIADDPDGIYIFYIYLGMPVFLGKLTDSDLHTWVLKAFRKFGRRVWNGTHHI